MWNSWTCSFSSLHTTLHHAETWHHLPLLTVWVLLSLHGLALRLPYWGSFSDHPRKSWSPYVSILVLAQYTAIIFSRMCLLQKAMSFLRQGPNHFPMLSMGVSKWLSMKPKFWASDLDELCKNMNGITNLETMYLLALFEKCHQRMDTRN